MELSEKEIKILECLLVGPLTASDIIKRTGIPRSTTYRLLDKLENGKLIRKENGAYRITILGRRLFEGLDGNIRVHACKVVLDALDVNLFVAKEKGKEIKMKNWNCYYLKLDKYGINATAQINIAEKTTVVLHLPEFRTKNLLHAMLIIQNLTAKCRRALEIEGLITEEEWKNFSFKVKYAEYGFKLPENDPSEPYEIVFDYNARGLFGEELDFKAKAWIDESPGYKELETNDTVYAHKRIMEPIWTEETHKRTERIEAMIIDVRNLNKEMKILVEDVHNVLFGFDDRFNQTLMRFNEILDRIEKSLNDYEKTFRAWNEMITSFTQSQKALSQNIIEHINLVSNVSNYAEEGLKALKIYKNTIKVLTISVLVLICLLIGVTLWKGA